MYNCVKVMRDGKLAAIFPNIDAAEMYVNLMKGTFGYLDIQWNCDWAYIENIGF